MLMDISKISEIHCKLLLDIIEIKFFFYAIQKFENIIFLVKIEIFYISLLNAPDEKWPGCGGPSAVSFSLPHRYLFVDS